MTYLVTGAAGFIGSYVVRQLLNEGETVVGFDRSWPGSLARVVGDQAAQVTQIAGEITDYALLHRVVQEHGVDRIIHLAGELHARSADNPGQCIQSNVVGTHNVLELGRNLDVARIVTASSAAVFGHPNRHPEGPIANDARLHAGDVYEAAKIFGESEGEYYFKRFGVDNVAIRIGLAYGYGCRIGWAARFVEELIEKPLRGEPGRVPWRDSMMNWVYADDAADGFVRASRTTTTDTFAYNLRGDPRTVAATVETARQLIPGADIDSEPGEHNWAQDFDDTLFRNATGYETRWTLRDGLSDIISRLQNANA
jgi:nucleoside-diphosphate-sugar epimerase